jgi:hypothetical protein
MSSGGIQWDRIGIELKPEISYRAMALMLPVVLEPYAAMVFMGLLEKAMDEITLYEGEVLDTKFVIDDEDDFHNSESTKVEVSITTDRLLDRFDPVELREQLDAWVSEAVAESERTLGLASDFVRRLKKAAPTDHQPSTSTG